VLIETCEVRSPLVPIAHLGVGCASREDVDRLVAEAKAEGRPTWGPIDAPYPVGYYALVSDPELRLALVALDDHRVAGSAASEV